MSRAALGFALGVAMVLLQSSIFHVDGQTPPTLASSIPRASLTLYEAYYLEGTSTASIGVVNLASCVHAGNGTTLQLINDDTGLVVASLSPVPLVGQLGWNITSHPTLTPDYSGHYRCVRDGLTSLQTFHLQVLVRSTITFMNDSFRMFQNESRSVECRGSGNPQVNASWIRLDSSMNPLTATNTLSSSSVNSHQVSSIFQAVGEEVAPQPPTTFTVQCSVSLPPVTCSPAVDMSVTAACQAALTPATMNTTITVYKHLPNLPEMNITFTFPNNDFTTIPPVNLTTQCLPGHKLTNGVINITGYTNGSWSTLPDCLVASGCSGNLGGSRILIFTSIMALLIL